MTSPPAAPSPARKGPFRRLGAWIASRPAALWAAIGPAPRTRRAISLGALLVAVGFGAFTGSLMRSGLGTLADIGIGAGIVLLGCLLAPLLIKLLAAALRAVPKGLGWFGTGALVTLALLLDLGLPEGFAYLSAIAMVAVAGLLTGSLAVLTAGDFKQAGPFKKVFAVSCLLAGLGGAGGMVWWTMDRGSTEHLVATPAMAADVLPPVLALDDPGAPGSHRVLTLTYGSGTDRRRPEYADQVAIVTTPVNGKPFAKMPGGMWGLWKESRKRFWGFGLDELPRNGRVWYPEGDGPFPLVLVVHGNHHMADFSDPGYAWLGELLASRGIITVSVDENFFNGSMVAGAFSKENDGRAWMLLEHLRLWREWNGTEGNPFAGKVDLDHIGLIGHSRGGEAVCLAAVFNRLRHYPDDASVTFDYDFSIRAVVSIAPVDGQYKPAGHFAAMRDVSYFTIHGGHDADVSSFHGDRIFQRLQFSGPGEWFKASLWVYRANHGQWNTVWGDTDTSPPMAWLLNRAALLPAEDQRRIAAVYIGAFLAANLQGQRGYVPLFADHHRGRDWLPDTPLVSRYQDPTFRAVCDFEEDVDVTTGSLPDCRIDAEGLVVWREGDIPLRGGGTRYNHGAFLGWKRTAGAEVSGEVDVAEASAGATAPVPASYTVSLPPDFSTGAGDVLVLDLAQHKEKAEAKDYSAGDEQDQETEAEQQGQEKPGDRPAEPEAADEEEGEEGEEEEVAPVDLTVELQDRDGTTVALPLSRFGVLLPPLKSRMTRLDSMERRYRSAYEPELQTFRLPLSAFAAADEEFAPDQVAAVRLVFDRAGEGVVILDRIGFAAAGIR